MDFDLETVIAIITAISVCASAITAVTPTPKDDRLWAKIYRVIEALGLVVGRAKEK